MISESYCKVLEKANRQLTLSWERVKKVRNTGNMEAIKTAEMAYLLALPVCLRCSTRGCCRWGAAIGIRLVSIRQQPIRSIICDKMDDNTDGFLTIRKAHWA